MCLEVGITSCVSGCAHGGEASRGVCGWGIKPKVVVFRVFELWTKHVTVPVFRGLWVLSHAFEGCVLLANPSVHPKSNQGCRSAAELAAGLGSVLAVPAGRGLWSMLFLSWQELPCRCTAVLLVLCNRFVSSPELSESFCWFAAVPRSTGSRFAGTASTSLWIPVQGRLKWVCAGIEARSGGFELVFAGCLTFCGNAFLKLTCCNADSGNLDGSTEYLLCVPRWMTLC